ncbi:hypothetical protein [Asanoa iriomotensis]|uniref:DUF2335 domain-containing protein n=1 Tax=Asanoa iriomotensis TaxID=234613 RepID=A0ABQ4CFJ3_9ACTN|nr:hypothetical protein [Asanoa iriomotensis]GIF61536.1 hypothetical protein Air01nite_76310 [Asanoa iriomotensis]
MAKQLPGQQPAAVRIIHYLDPATGGGELTSLTERELIARRKRDQIVYVRWLERRAVIAERDRKVRRFWLGLGIVFGLGALAVIGGLVWFLFNATAALGLGLLGIPLAILALGGLAVGGHKCVTIVQHMH